MTLRFHDIGTALFAAAIACGCGSKTGHTSKPVDDEHVADDLDVDDPGTATDAGAAAGDGDGDSAGGGAADAGDLAPSALVPAGGAPLSFMLVNDTEKDLAFSVEKGWGTTFAAWSGEAGKGAKSVLMFPRHCTAACDSAEADRCPYCPRPKKAKDEAELEKREVVPPGKSIEVPWDGDIYVYKKTRVSVGKKKKCDCYSKKKVPSETYTVRACGLHVTTSAKHTSQYFCATAQVTLPSANPQVIKLEGWAPPTRKK